MIQKCLYCLILVQFIFSEVTRLPETIIPVKYSLKLTVYLDGYINLPTDKNQTFEGVVEIDLNIKENVLQITFNSFELTFEKEDCELFDDSGRIDISDLKKTQELSTIYFNGTISGDAIIKIKYTGNFSKVPFGLYRDRVVYSKPTLISQSFPLTHMIVPCFNEPWMKAVWEVEITHPVGSVALSNTPEKQIVYSSLENFKTTQFYATPIMSPYQLAIIISDYKYTSGYSDSGTLVRVFAPLNKLNKTNHALQVAINSLNKFEITFDINYPLSKLDLFPVKTFPASAMENWGLVIFQESSLIGYDLKSMEEVVIHVVAHQWFGNLVTMAWYNDYWLNEAFATIYETDSENKQLYDYYESYSSDAVDSPLRYLNTNNMWIQFTQPNDQTVYVKGSLVLNMLKKVIGTWRFRKGIRRYLKENSYKSVNTQILKSYFADSMPENSPNIDDFLDPWVEQVGHPLIIVKHFNKTHDILSQQRFDNNQLDVYDQKFATPKWNYTWYIPLWYKNDVGDKERLIWLKPGELKLIEVNQTTTITNPLCRFNVTGSNIESLVIN
ncbi:unnamed protein product [Caenorhabditis angaria]|uniref:Peptidase M1 membrane alanine aminopeptidase domain-containing protein n=1 Tax=Caenorhabditis angaria TaxID=860376 RepID=A0A9P1J3H4_9PELO|nr:unnamed protein product [Caenorhabditis angaria]